VHTVFVFQIARNGACSAWVSKKCTLPVSHEMLHRSCEFSHQSNFARLRIELWINAASLSEKGAR
jgi:hypothetical protein